MTPQDQQLKERIDRLSGQVQMIGQNITGNIPALLQPVGKGGSINERLAALERKLDALLAKQP